MGLYQKKLYFINVNLYKRILQEGMKQVKMGMTGHKIQPNFSVATRLVGML